MSDEPLNEAIQRARKAMELARDVNEEDFLGKILNRIAEGDVEDETLPDQLEEQALAFEVNHPKLSGALREVMDALQRMGI